MSKPRQKYVTVNRLNVEETLYNFVASELTDGLDISAEKVWESFTVILDEHLADWSALLAKRDEIQQQIDLWHKTNQPFNRVAYQKFLSDIGYVEPLPFPFVIETKNIDPEISVTAGPQLVVPADNARFAINAANARWGSLFDALYGTDVIGENTSDKSYDAARGDKVIETALSFLDSCVPLKDASYKDVTSFRLGQNGNAQQLVIRLKNDKETSLQDVHQFSGYLKNDNSELSAVLLNNNGLHIEVCIDRSHHIGQQQAAGIKDILLESAVSTILDAEDSVAAVDGKDKTNVYRNMLGLMRGNLTASFQKGGKTINREQAANREYCGTDGNKLQLKGQSLLLMRNVGHLMRNNAVTDEQGNPVPEGFLDAMMTTLCAMHDLRKNDNGSVYPKNSVTGSIYIVKPKMHGPAEAAFTDRLFTTVEKTLGLPRYTVKIGLMDEERRTTLNLPSCIEALKNRLFFINTGFLDRTGDEIHTSMFAGVMQPKGDMKSAMWYQKYEQWNVDIGLMCGLQGRAQIGKGMWPKPDEMHEMMQSKKDHLLAGASCAWVPSPTAATLHAMHYHEIDVFDLQNTLFSREKINRDDLLQLPIINLLENPLPADVINNEIENNCQGILGYVVRWVSQGIGCSKVPDIHNTGLMEDRATLRISSQHLANWLLHGVCSEKEVLAALEKMAAVVDKQNAGDKDYQPMVVDGVAQGVAFEAAKDLIFKGVKQPSGYTEPLLHARRSELKAQTA